SLGAGADGRRRGSRGVHRHSEERRSRLARISRPSAWRKSHQPLALAATASRTSSVSMRPARPGAILIGALLAAARLPAQRSALPFGLQGGRHDVGVRVVANSGHNVTVWYPARCGRRPADPIHPCAGAAPDSGLDPVLILGSVGRAAEDTARAVYFATHGYVVVLSSFADALVVGRALPSSDTTQIVIAAAGATAAPGIRAIVELDPATPPPRADGA